MWHMTHDIWHMTHDIWHMTYRGWWIWCPKSRSKALMFWEQWCLEDFEKKITEWTNESQNSVYCVFHRDFLEDAGKGLLVLYLDLLFPLEDNQVSWKTEYRWDQGELFALPLVPFMNSSSRWRMWRSMLIMRGGEEGRRTSRK